MKSKSGPNVNVCNMCVICVCKSACNMCVLRRYLYVLNACDMRIN